MGQMSWRAPDSLLERVRRVAEQWGWSMNEYVTRVLDAATDPGTAPDEAAALRERLARAGLLAPPGAPRHRPDAGVVARARRAAGKDKPLSEVVNEGRE